MFWKKNLLREKYGIDNTGVSNSSRTELYANFLEKARVCQVRTFFLSLRTVHGVCLPIILLHNKQYNVNIFLKTIFFFDLVRSAYFSSKFREPLPELLPNFFSNCSVQFGSKMFKFEFGSVWRFSKMHTSNRQLANPESPKNHATFAEK
jgi:hypothetical protein